MEPPPGGSAAAAAALLVLNASFFPWEGVRMRRVFEIFAMRTGAVLYVVKMAVHSQPYEARPPSPSALA